MKAIILISSIFYLLGLKISHKIDLIKKGSPADKVITNKVVAPEKKAETIDYNEAAEIEAKKDTVVGAGSTDKHFYEYR